VTSTVLRSSPSGGSTWRASIATSRPAAGHGRRWPAACAPGPASPATLGKKAYWPAHRRSMSPATDRLRVPPRWTATRSAPCQWPRGLAPPRPRPGLPARPQLATGVVGHRRRHRPPRLARGHRTPTITRKGVKLVTIPLAPRTSGRSIWPSGASGPPVFTGRDDSRLDRHAAGRICPPDRPTGRDHQARRSHTLRHAFITAALDTGVSLRDFQEAPGTPIPGRPCAPTVPAPGSTGTAPTSSPSSSPAPPGSRRAFGRPTTGAIERPTRRSA
jgi:hypothetical protein